MIHLSYSMLVFTVLTAAAVGLWYDGARAREAANRIAADACRRRSLQLLDGTVALAGFRPRLDRHGLRIERTYVFDYAVDGVMRASGFIIMVGQEMEHLGLERNGAG
jgi:hypothetical protein